MSLHERILRKPDGRALYLYSDRPIADAVDAPSPRDGGGEPPEPHLRWHPLRGEWVAYASHRQNRTFLPPKDYSPLAVTRSAEFPTEVPAGDYDVAVFENRFPSFNLATRAAPALSVPSRPATGVCEVVVFTQDPEGALGRLPLEKVRLVLEVLGKRSRALGARPEIAYVLPFENRGVEMGVTLHHPHGQIYSYPFVPPVPERMLARMAEYRAQHGRGLLADLVAEEIADGSRIVAREDGAVGFVPVCARYPYETWIAPETPRAYLHDLSPEELTGLARTLKTILLKYDGLWGRTEPYLMTLYQAPYDDRPHPEAHVHFQIYPPYRTRDRLKFLAGTELGAGVFVNDSLPEEKARELREARIEEAAP